MVAGADRLVLEDDRVLGDVMRCRRRSRTSRALICRAASTAAMPLRSAPTEPAVGEALGTLSVAVAVIRTRARSRPSSLATTCATLVWTPWPISVPPWLRWTEPSR